MATGRGGSKIKEKLGFLVYGQKGTWKSSFALEFMKLKREDGKPFRVLYIDAENGSVDSYLYNYEAEGYDLRNIFIIYTQSISEVNDFIKRAKNGEDFYEYDDNGEETDTVYLDADGEPFRPDAIVVDGVTLLYVAKQQSMMEFSKKRATVRANKNEITGLAREVAIEGANIEIKDYQGLKLDGQNLVLNLLASGKHFIVTCREEDEKENAKDNKNEFQRVSTGRKIASGFKDIGYNVKTVLRLFKDDDGIIKAHVEDKDRTMVHKQDEILTEPTLLDWQVVIDKNKNKKDFVVNNDLDKAIEAERKAIEKENARFEEAFEEDDEKETTFDSPEDYYDAIKNCIAKFDNTGKAKRQQAIADAGLPRNYRSLKNMDKLKQYYDIVK